MEETAARLTEGVDDRLDRIARIYRFVTTDIRYVGLEFGEHRFRPFSADWVLNHKIGDCKDKANLLRALLRHKGIRSYLALLNAEHAGRGHARHRRFHLVLVEALAGDVVELDAEALFYLRSRGVPQAEAEALLTEAFIAEVFDAIDDEAIQEVVVQLARDWLAANASR